MRLGAKGSPSPRHFSHAFPRIAKVRPRTLMSTAAYLKYATELYTRGSQESKIYK
jgi:hypothetical protein